MFLTERQESINNSPATRIKLWNHMINCQIYFGYQSKTGNMGKNFHLGDAESLHDL